jgi:hypothetical protein
MGTDITNLSIIRQTAEVTMVLSVTVLWSVTLKDYRGMNNMRCMAPAFIMAVVVCSVSGLNEEHTEVSRSS